MSAQEVSASRDWLGARRAACKSEDYPRTGLRKVERTGARAGVDVWCEGPRERLSLCTGLAACQQAGAPHNAWGCESLRQAFTPPPPSLLPTFPPPQPLFNTPSRLHGHRVSRRLLHLILRKAPIYNSVMMMMMMGAKATCMKPGPRLMATVVWGAAACFHTVTTPFHLDCSYSVISANVFALFVLFFLICNGVLNLLLLLTVNSVWKNKCKKKKYSTIWWRPPLSHLSQ